ncbi:MAG TPA: glycosyltransferase family 4 protein [Actinomycetota bacterium]
MKIALACPYAWDAPGGVQVHVAELARNLRGRDHDVLVLAPARKAAEEPGVTIVGRAVGVPYQGTVAPICFSVRAARRVGAALRRFEPDVVHAHEPLSPSIGMLAAYRASAPVVGTFHAHAERSVLLTAAAPALGHLWRRLAVRVAVSEAAAGFVRSRFHGEVRIIPNGCDVELFATGQREEGLPPGRQLLWVGRLDPQKGFGVALDAFEALLAERLDVNLIVIGDGRDRSLADRLPAEVRARIHLLGSVRHDRLPGYHRAADVFVAPAIGQESFGVVLVEAMAAGLPVVATDIAGYREVVRDGVEGLLVPPNDPRALGAAIERILSDPELAGRLRAAGKTRAERYRWDRVVEDVERAYADAIALAGERPSAG